MDANREAELKLALPSSEALRDLGKAALRAGAKRHGKPMAFRSVYFDTSDHKLRNSGYVLKVRRDGRHSVQTLKTIERFDSGLRRARWDAAVDVNGSVSNAADDLPLSEVLSEKERQTLRPIFTVEVDRDTYVLDRGETVVEVALDQAVVRHLGSAEQRVIEAELKLRKGEPPVLFALAREIGALVPSLVSLIAKSDRGYRALTGKASRPATRPAFALNPHMPTIDVARAVVHTAHADLFGSLATLLEQGGDEPLHQARVCVRRLRAILTLLGPLLDWPEGSQVRAELKWLADLLRDARELDVFISGVLEPLAAAEPDTPGLDAMTEAFRARREHAHASVADVLRSPRPFALSLDLLSDFELALGGPQRTGKHRHEAMIGGFLTRELSRRLASLLKDSRALDHLDPETRHGVRIRAKKFRYMIEPFRDLFPRKQFRKLASSLEKLQDSLGALNDGKVNREIALGYAKDVLAGAGDASPLFAAGRAAARCTTCEAKALEAAMAARERLARVPELDLG